MMAHTYYLGIDAGGTQCKAALYDKDGNCVGKGLGGPGNPVNGLALAQNGLIEAANSALKDANLNSVNVQQLQVGAGIAGLHLPAMQQAMEQWRHPFHSFYCTTDLHAAVTGMHQGQDGGVIILGTGFSALGKVKNELHAIGGYGFPINAEGSGAWLGLQAVKSVLLAHDGIGPHTSMLAAMTEHEDVLTLASRLNHASSTEFATFAPLVFAHAEQGDLLAKAIIEQATEFLQRVILRLNATGVDAIVLVGSVAQRLQSRLKKPISECIVQGKASAEYGAMLLAKQHTPNE